MLIQEFVNFMIERENIRLRKEDNEPWPWTQDHILQTYKFTNVHRSDDRTTREFKKIYDELMAFSTPPQILYACGVCRYFGAAEFIKNLPRGLLINWDPEKLMAMAQYRRMRGLKVFTSAYVITNGGRPEPKEKVVVDYLAGLWNASAQIFDKLTTTGTWQAGYRELVQLPGFGGSGFMAKEVLQDFLMNYPLGPLSDRDTWTPMGPGGRRGMNRVMLRDLDFTQSETKFIKECQELRTQVLNLWPVSWVPLTAHDVQFQLCEFDKYMRVKMGTGKPKALYHPRSENLL
jgi:hypothetical protein